MPCLFLENVSRYVNWEPKKLKKFHAIARQILLGHPIEVHVRSVVYTLLLPTGEVPALFHGVHGFIHWHEGRTTNQMQSLGDAIQELLDGHEIGGGFDLTFIGGPRGRSFYVNQKLVEE